MSNISTQKQTPSSLDETSDILNKLQDALDRCPPRKPYRASDPIPTDLLSWTARKDSPSRKHSFFASLPHHSLNGEQTPKSSLSELSLIQEQDKAQISPDHANSLLDKLQDALDRCPRRQPYKASDPIPTDLLLWSPRKDLTSSHQNDSSTPLLHTSSNVEANVEVKFR